ncbi:hypothetical protein DPMN_011674 [Dreissena polymorpha]|uniref:Uncharacterized protein n=1 Tax=Dreissena polymorpha TaxID=45954 RepID=A0A9D4S0I8_DREPO|nr:hypothetical protein DPMN_011674 [Dreissena polymorpha]
MYGQNVGRLSMFVQYGLTVPFFPLWLKQGTQGNQWIQAQVRVAATRPFNVSIVVFNTN